MSKYKVAGYLRLSQEDGDKDISDSIVSQKNIIENKVKELGEEFELKEYYIDDGYTGLNTNRPAFQKMLQDIETGKINSIITKDLSRLSRNSFEANYYIELYFLERNIRYISVLDNVDTGIKSSNNDIIQFKTLINDWYSKDISRKIKSSIWARKEKGMYMAAVAPYGYKKSDEDKHKLVIDEVQAITIKRIFNQFDSGVKISNLVKILQEEKIPSPNNNYNNGEIMYKWSPETIRRILTNKLYLGHTQYGKRINLSYKSKKVKYVSPEEWKIAYNTHDAIIDKELFDRVQNRMNINKNIKKRKHEWELNGIVVCKECSNKMTLKVKYAKNNSNEIKSKKIYCLNGLKNKDDKCIRKCKGIDEDIVNYIVQQNLRKFFSSLDKEKLVKIIVENLNKTDIDYNKNILSKQLKKLENETRVLYNDYKNHLLDVDDYTFFYQELLENKKRIKKELEKQENKVIVLDEKRLEVVWQDIYNMKSINKDVVLKLIDNIEIDKDNRIYIYYK